MLKRSIGLLILIVLASPLPVLAGNWKLVTKVGTVGGKMNVDGGPDQLYGVTRTATFASPPTEDVAVMITADPGYQIAAVLINGVRQTLPIASPATFQMGLVQYPGAISQTVYAYFTKATFQVAVTAGPGGAAGPQGTWSMGYGTVKDFVFTPYSGNRVIDIENLSGQTYELLDYATSQPVAVLPGEVDQRILVRLTVRQSVTLNGVFLALIADAGIDQTVLINAPVTLVATSEAPAGSTVHYSWSQISGPTVILTAADTATPSFTTGALTTEYGFKVTVATDDGLVGTDTTKVYACADVADAGYAQCQVCHESNGVGEQAQVFDKWVASPHQAHTVMCYACHTGANTGNHPGATPTSATCEGCHGTRHGLQYIDCLNCHDPHSTAGAGGDGCVFCHDYPPASGSHLAHFGLESSGGPYADVQTLEARFPTATMETAPKVYAFGCALCHSVDSARHMNGTVDVILYEAAADPGSLKARNAAAAAYDAVSGTCSGVYCHSSGQATPTCRTTPGWNSGEHLACDGCHGNPPAYPTGGEGTATANTHLILADDGYEYGHFLGMPGPWHTSQHGASTTVNSAPITCQTCHYETTDPANIGPNGFYYLDTSGSYRLDGNTDPLWQDKIQCDYCHQANDPDGRPATGSGKVLPLRHINGQRDVIFDPREDLPASSWLPAVPNRPTRPYWLSQGSKTVGWPTDGSITWDGTTLSFGLSDATYDPATKTCYNTKCHLEDAQPTWGRQIEASSWGVCCNCHTGYCF